MKLLVSVSFFSIEPILRYGSQVLILVLLARMLQLGLIKRYPFFTIFLIAYIIRDALLFGLDSASPAYTLRWTQTIPFIWFVQLLAALEVFRLITKRYPGIEGFAEKLLFTSFVVGSIVAAVLSLSAGLPNTFSFWTRNAFLVSRLMFLLIALLLLIQAIVFSATTVKVSQNLSLHRWLLAAYCSVGALSGFIAPLENEMLASLGSLLLLVVACACLLTWILKLSAAGEVDPAYQRTMTDAEIETAKVNFDRMTKEISRTSLRSLFFGNRR